MARDLSGASQYIEGSSGVISTVANPITMFIRARRNSTTTEGYAGGLGGTSSSNALIAMRGDVGADPIQARIARSGNGVVGVNAGTYSSDTWTACTLIVKGIGATDNESWQDNTQAVGSNATVQWSPTFAANQPLFGRFPDGSGYLIGMIASFAIWGAALTAAEIASLVAGFSPRRIRPSALDVYVPHVRAIQDICGKILSWTEGGSPGVFEHPRSYGV